MTVSLYDRLVAHIRAAETIRAAAEQATSLPELLDAIRAALAELRRAEEQGVTR